MRITRTRFQLLTLLAMATIGLVMAPINAHATALIIPDSGILAVSNQTGTLVGVTGGCINWGGGSACAGASHTMLVSGVSSIFSIGTGTITDETLSGPFVQPFETVTGAGVEAGNTIDFNITSVPTNGATAQGTCSGAGANAAFNSCTPQFSPFTLAENSTGTQVTVTFSVLLAGYTGAVGTGSTPYQAIFQTTFSGNLVGTGGCNGLTANITNILTCEAGGGTITSTWSGTESPTPTTPEPLSFVLFGSGLVGVAVFGRRFRRS